MLSYPQCGLFYHIYNVDAFEIMHNNEEIFDLSNYDKSHVLYDGTNNKVIGKFKNESPIKQKTKKLCVLVYIQN